MGSKKKGKGSKLARMSDEERARYLQHRAAIEEEAKRRKEQLIETFIKNKLKKEEAFSRLNVAKINQEWRQTLRVYKCSELKEDLKALHYWFDHAVKKKSELIECLLKDLNEAEIQYSRIYQCHMETIDKILEIYNNRIKTMQKSFEDERDKIFTSACLETKEMLSDANAHEEHLQAIIYRMNQTSEEKIKKVNESHNIRVDELRNHMLTEIENLVNSKEGRMENIWNNFEVVLQRHWSQTEDRRREYLNLRQADSENCNHIFEYHQQINSLNAILSGLKKQSGAKNSEGNEQVIEKKADLTSSLELFHVLRYKLKNERELDARKLRKMTVTAENSIKDLKKTREKSQRIHQLITLCRKHETTYEKTCHVNFGVTGINSDDSSDPTQKSELQFDESLSAEAYERFHKMEGFWIKFNQVFIEKEALSVHNQALLSEQKQLKIILKQYFKEFAEKQILPKVPLIHRPLSTSNVNKKGIMLRGEKLQACSGKMDVCTARSHSSYLHMLTIELTKPLTQK